ncbi:hypothetical protein F5888DRAFT_1793214 [Russula emetica]|nr:hypothetical protein F5888DRAFT_1793214 [Russula emetica]
MSTPATASAAASTSQLVTLPHIPELFNHNFLDVLLPPRPVLSTDANIGATVPKSAFMDALKSVARHRITENGAPAFSSTLSSTLDAFQSLSVHMDTRTIDGVLARSWAEDPALTLKIIWNTRSIHDGKSDKELFYRAFGWLYEHHPRTAISNLSQLVTPVCVIKSKRTTHMPHGYWKDLLNILALAALEQFDVRRSEFLHGCRGRTHKYQIRSTGPSKMTRAERRATKTPEERDALLAAKNQKAKTMARDRRVKRAADAQASVLAALSRARFRALYIAVARLFAAELVGQAALMRRAETLSDDQQEEQNRILRDVSLVGKWAPTPGASHDRVTNISTAIAILLHHDGAMSSLSRPVNTSDVVSSEDAHVLRSFYQRWVLTPLRASAHVPEPLMAARRWNEVSYKHVASKCMHINSKHFLEHDAERFEAYLDSVAEGKAKISGATLLPHELLAKAVSSLNSEYVQDGSSAMPTLRTRIAKREAQVINAQWDAMIARLRCAGTLDNCLAICDVSGSMGNVYTAADLHNTRPLPILPAVALSMTLAQLAKPPFSNIFITFSAKPEIVTRWGMNTNLHAVFVSLLLPLAVKHHVPREEMVKRLFVFSDMQFDAADGAGRDSGGPGWETNHDAITRVYAEAGYDVPEIVYWNLAGELQTVPVEAERKGVALMSGFSPAMMKVFMGKGEETDAEDDVLDDDTVMVDEQGEEIKPEPAPRKQEMTPLSVMMKALGMASYNNLIVLD